MTKEKVRTRIESLELLHPFTIAHGRSLVRETVIVEVADGSGEGAIVPYLGEPAAEVVAAIQRAAAALPTEIDRIEDTLIPAELGSKAAACAIEMALFDHIGKRHGVPLGGLIEAPRRERLETSITVAMDTPDRMAARVREAHAPIYKIKVGGDADEEALEAIRGVTNARLRLDANGGWSRDRAAALIPRLERFGVELIEQPCSPSDPGAFEWLASRGFRMPIFADESVGSLAELVELAPHLDGVVVKLRKFGGIGAAREAIRVARSHGLQIMMGCMIESSLAVTAAAHLAQLCDLVDLDAPLLIGNDPYVGVTYRDFRLELPGRPGIGAVPRRS